MVMMRILLVDDNQAMLADLHEELASDGFTIAGTAHDGEDALQLVASLDPDVLVIDITMPGLNGFQVATRLRESHPRTKILFLTIHEEPEYISAAFTTGAYGYVSKRRLNSDLAHAIREVFAGRTFLSPSLQK